MKNEKISYLTKERIASSLKGLMKKKAFDKITVKDISDDCDISRSAFYYHFEDMYDLMKWTFESEALELLKASENSIDWDDGILSIFRYVHDNRKICLCAYNSIGKDLLKKMLYDGTSAIMRAFINNILQDVPADKEHADFIGKFYTEALVNCLVTWMLEGEPYAPEEMIKLLEIAMHGNIMAALQRSAEKNLGTNSISARRSTS